MKKLLVLTVILVIVAVLLIPIYSGAVPDNGKGKAGGNGNHNGWDKGKDDGEKTALPEPSTLALLGLGIAGVGSYLVVKMRGK